MRRWSALAILIGISSAAGLEATPNASPGVENQPRAWQNWVLQCQGCHRPDATGSPQTTPAMAGHVSRFLHVPGGREYLGRVPGVATAALSDRDLAELLNWTLRRYDPENLPADFKPYTPEEVGRLRRMPLRTEAYDMRVKLMAAMEAKASGQ